LTEAFARLNQVPLAFFPRDKNPDNENFFYIYIKMTGTYFIIYCLKLKHRLENAGRLLIELPVHPSTVEELALVRFWLLKLSQTHFENLYANHGILNPEFLSVLNPITGPMKILFHANNVEVEVFDSKVVIPADFAQFICARRIVFHTSFLDEPHRNNLFKFIMGTGNTLEKVHIYSFGAKQGEFCEFLVKVNFDHFLFFVSKFDDLVYHAHGNRTA
jgi:hypothetical protein